MTEHDDSLRSADDDVDPVVLARLHEELAELSFLRPEDTTAAPMPAEVWDRLRAALAAEAAAETAAEAAVSSGQEPPSAATRARSRRWATGLVAASVAVVAVGVGATVLRDTGSGGGAVVAGESTGSVAAAAPDVADASLSFAGMVPPTLRLVDSHTDYTSASLRDQVSDVMTRLGVEPSAETLQQAITPPAAPPEAAAADALALKAEAMPVDVPAQGFTATPEALRACITKLTEAAVSTAILVDRTTYEGRSAAVIVAPDYPDTGVGTPPTDVLEISVVDPDCDLTMRVWMHLHR